MFGRWAAIEHRERDTGSFEPLLSDRFVKAASRLQGRFDQVKTLIQPITAEPDVGWIFPDRLDPVGGLDHVQTANCERVHPEQFTQLVDRGFDGKIRLRGDIAPKAPFRDNIGVDRKADCFLVWATIDRKWISERLSQCLAAMAAVGTRI